MKVVKQPTPLTLRSQTMSVVKLACVHAGQVPALFEFDQVRQCSSSRTLITPSQKEPLAQIINKLCEGWRIPNPDQWSFKDDATKFYITEKVSMHAYVLALAWRRLTWLEPCGSEGWSSAAVGTDAGTPRCH